MVRFFRSTFALFRSFLALVAPAAILLMHFAVMLCFINRWDPLVAITLVPIWAWAGVGMILSLLAWTLLKSRLSILTFFIWLATGLFCADETPGLYRLLMSKVDPEAAVAVDPETPTLRVVTVNCSGEKIAAAEAVKPLQPDIVFLQETPEDPAELERLTQELFENSGTFLLSVPCAILARGTLTETESPEGSRSLAATLETPDGQIIDLVNLHLQRAVPCRRIWETECRNALTETRIANRRTLRRILEKFPERVLPSTRIIGGDFGTPANDDIYRLLRSQGYRDSFREAGIGLGNTFTADTPLIRIDQIWSSEQLEAVHSEAVRNPESDHRMVATDYSVVKPDDAAAAVAVPE